jgi:pimeloyl-ACP methyl ester carboxylesterase
MTTMGTLKILLIFAILIYIGGCTGMYFFQRKFIYFPTPSVAVPGIKEIAIRHSGLRLQGYVANSGKSHVLFYFGGNAEIVASSIADLAEQLPVTTIIGFDYRGYGNSEGRPNEKALYQDALAQYDAFADGYETASLLGRSLGSGVATYLASKRPVDSLILVTPFDSIARLAADHYRFLPVRWLIKDRFDSASRAGDITAPTLILAAENDSTVPAQSTKNLKQKFNKHSVTAIRIDDVGHNTIGRSPLYAHHIRDFLRASLNERRIEE